MKKINYFLGSFLIIIALTLLVACGQTTKQAKLPVLVTNGTKEEGVYAFQALSSVNLLGDTTTSTKLSAGLSFNVTTLNKFGLNDAKDKVITDEQITRIHNYLLMLEQILNGDHPISVNVTESDLEGYAHKMVIKSSTLLNEEIEYVLYYNEVVESELDDDMDEDDDDDEIKTSFEGVMHVGELVYTVKGGKEVEGNEEELNFVSYLDKNNWVRVKQERESDDDGSLELNYKYVVCRGGVIVDNAHFKIDTEDGKTKVHLMYLVDNKKYRYEFKEEVTSEGTFIKIHIKEGFFKEMIRVKVTVDPETGDLSYEYRLMTNNRSIFKHKDDHPFQNKKGPKNQGKLSV